MPSLSASVRPSASNAAGAMRPRRRRTAARVASRSRPALATRSRSACSSSGIELAVDGARSCRRRGRGCADAGLRLRDRAARGRARRERGARTRPGCDLSSTTRRLTAVSTRWRTCIGRPSEARKTSSSVSMRPPVRGSFDGRASCGRGSCERGSAAARLVGTRIVRARLVRLVVVGTRLVRFLLVRARLVRLLVVPLAILVAVACAPCDARRGGGGDLRGCRGSRGGWCDRPRCA